LEGKGITSVEELSDYTEKEIMSLHGVGKTALVRMKEALDEAGLRFKEE
jgi:DNA-directed RNA polymerase alpha subunit